ALVVDGETRRRDHPYITVFSFDGLQVVAHPLPELPFTVVGFSLVKARKLSVHVHDFLTVWVLRWRGSFYYPNFTRLPVGFRVPIRCVIQVNHWKLSIALGFLVPRLTSRVRYGKNPTLT